MNSSKILVTGGAGFLGSHLVKVLLERGHEVTVFDLKRGSVEHPKLSYIIGSLTSKNDVDKAVSGAEYVYHFGAVADIDVAKHEPYRTMEVNILGTVNILESCRKFSVKQILFASSIYVYSKSGSFYRISKHAGELLLEEYKEKYGLDYSILRFGTLYGTNSDEHNSVYRYLYQALNDKEITFNGTGEEIREYIHANDAATICADLLSVKHKNESFILTGHHRMKVIDLLNMIKEILGGEVEIKHDSQGRKSHYTQTPYSYSPKVGRKIVSSTYNDLGQSLVEILNEIDKDKVIEVKLES